MKKLVIKVLQEVLLMNRLLKQKEEEMSLNSLTIMGNLTRIPEKKQTPSGKEVCSFSIANNRVYMKNSEKTTEVSYFDVEAWGTLAENCFKYLTKGSGVIVEGRLRQERWEKDGKNHSHVRITANAVHFLPKKQEKDSTIPSSVEELQTADSTSQEVLIEG